MVRSARTATAPAKAPVRTHSLVLLMAVRSLGGPASLALLSSRPRLLGASSPVRNF